MRQILDRESNTGVIVYKGGATRGGMSRLLTRETFARAQRRLHRPQPAARCEAGKLLAGLLVCGHCGA